jgi:hypothetical protein
MGVAIPIAGDPHTKLRTAAHEIQRVLMPHLL